MHQKQISLLVFLVSILVIGALSIPLLWPGEDTSGNPEMTSSEGRVFGSNDPVARGCRLDSKYLVRIWRGHDTTRSEDVHVVPLEPNYWGTFLRTSHTGPWEYLQRVPLVLYGPGRIESSGAPVQRHASITDVYPTVERLLGLDLPLRRGGEVIDDALLPQVPGQPKLIVTMMWDGVGRNVLERWPSRWPNLARLEREGTSLYGATVGSSPSITPSTHSSLGTGAFPRSHRVTGIDYRTGTGQVKNAFAKGNPRLLRLTTYADEVDRLLGNRSKVGLLGWQIDAGTTNTGRLAYQSNHIGMLGHGAGIPGGDRDDMALIGHDGEVTANPEFYRRPAYLRDFPTGLRRHAAALDGADGRADGEWLGHDILASHDNPAWVNYEASILKMMLRNSRFGEGGAPDLLFANFKPTDIVGHRYTLDSREMAQTLEATDAALGRLIEELDRSVGDYVMIVTGDHGHTRSPDVNEAWPVSPTEVEEDINQHFGVADDDSLIETTTAVGLFLDWTVAGELGVRPGEIARFLNDYTLRDNWGGDELPAGYENRGSENVLQASFSKRQLPDIMRCAFGAEKPPADLDA